MTVVADLPNLRREVERLTKRVEQLERQSSTVVVKLADLAGLDGDVDLSGISNGDTLVFHTSDGKWHAE